MKRKNYGKVYFIGAGPGDPELLTLKAARLLSLADVVITDRLVSEAILSGYVRPDAVIIPAGKQGGSNNSTPQYEINDLIVRCAKTFDQVVRLKGGDVSLYSNILDELITVKEYGIPYEIVPGITAASGASACTGVPLTARQLANGVRIISYHHEGAIAEHAWQQLASFEDTLVLYMSASALPGLVGRLLDAGADPAIPFLVVEQATTPQQHVHTFTLGQFQQQAVCPHFISPSLVIMGKVTTLYQQFAWLPDSTERKPYFKTLEDNPELITLINNLQSQHVSRA